MAEKTVAEYIDDAAWAIDQADQFAEWDRMDPGQAVTVATYHLAAIANALLAIAKKGEV